MDAKEYAKLAMRTKGENFSQKELIVNAALGLCGESVELASAVYFSKKDEITKEAGDLFWYICLMCDSCNLEFDRICSAYACDIDEKEYPQNNEIISSIQEQTGLLVDIVKKHYFQGHELYRDQVAIKLREISILIACICDRYGLSIDQVMSGNIEKLEKRYPNLKFESDKSVNRVD